MTSIGLAIWLAASYRKLGFINGLGEIPTRQYWAASPLVQVLWRDTLTVQG